jgi:hypothetical protein
LSFPIWDPADVPAGTTTLDAAAVDDACSDYPDRDLVSQVVGAIRHGFHLGYTGPLLSRGRLPRPNLRMSDEELTHVRTEVSLRRQAGQVAPYTAEDAVVSPIGVVPKASGKLRTIHHLSFPRRGPDPSVNDGITPSALAYESLDSLFAQVAGLNPGQRCQVWKVDLQDAFRHCVVASSQRRLLCFHLDGVTYSDLALPFGLRSSPFLFNLVAELLHWCAERLGLQLSHYLDDFFGVAEQAHDVIAIFRDLAASLGFRINPAKCVVGEVVEVLGIEVDVPGRRASITPARRADLIAKIDDILARGTASLLELQSVAGTLVFVTRICPTGRAFLRRLFDACSYATGTAFRRRVPTAARDDLRWWRSCLGRWDGIAILGDRLPSCAVTTDASGSKGAGGWLSHEGHADSNPSDSTCAAAFSVPLPRRHRNKDIIFKEAWALLHAARRWTTHLQSRHVLFTVDNSALASSLRSGSIRQRSTHRPYSASCSSWHWSNTSRSRSAGSLQGRTASPMPSPGSMFSVYGRSSHSSPGPSRSTCPLTTMASSPPPPPPSPSPSNADPVLSHRAFLDVRGRPGHPPLSGVVPQRF